MKTLVPWLALVACGVADADWGHAVRYAERARGLELVGPVENEIVTPAALVAERGGLSRDDETKLHGTLGRLGFFAPTDDLVALDAKQVGTNLAGFYRDGKVSVTEDSSWSLVVHEYVHALQDQHFGVFARSRLATTDATLAFAALFEGDAQLAQLAYERAPEDPGIDRALLIDTDLAGQLARDRLAAWTEPDWFVRSSAFVYGFGARYAAAVYAREGGNGGIDHRLQYAPPSTTQEVLRAGLELDAVESVGTAWTDALEVDSLGEWLCRILFGRALADSEAETLAHGWDGDELATFAGAGLAWTSIWDDDAIAERVRWTLESIRPGGMVVDVRGRRVVVASSIELADAALR